MFGVVDLDPSLGLGIPENRGLELYPNVWGVPHGTGAALVPTDWEIPEDVARPENEAGLCCSMSAQSFFANTS